MTTRYEIAAEKNGKRYIVAYTARKTKKSLLFNIGNYGHKIIDAIGADIESVCTKATRDEIVMSDGTRVFFTGRTELDVLRESAL